jgi:hypothetical protein
MKRKKLSLDKLVLGSLSEAEQANVMGGDDAGTGSATHVNTVCVMPSLTQPKTSYIATCPLTTQKPYSTNMTCPVSHS